MLKILSFLLFQGGVRHVPQVVWRSKTFWISLVVMIVASILYHNFFRKRGTDNFMRKFFSLSTGSLNAAKIQYSSEGRCGHVWYRSKETEFAMYYEFGGGDCVTTVQVPSPENWEHETKLPLERRGAVLDFIGRQVVKDQTSSGSGYFKIEGDLLNIYLSP